MDAAEGTPQGAVISPLLANIYLHPLDERMSGLGYRMVRYADDFVVLCKSREEARRTGAAARLRGRMGSVCIRTRRISETAGRLGRGSSSSAIALKPDGGSSARRA